MKKLFELRKQYKEALDNAEKLQNLADSEERELTEDEQSVFDEYMAAADSLEPKIANLEKLQEKLKNTNFSSDQPVGSDVPKPVPLATNVHDRREDDPKCGFANFGEQAIAVQAASSGGSVDERLLVSSAAQGNNTVIGSEGGFAISPQFSNDIYGRLMGEQSNLLALTDNYTITGSSLTFKAVDGTVRTSGQRYGGVYAYWTEEGGQITKSEVKLRDLTLKPKKLAALVYATNELLEQSTAMTQIMNRGAVAAIGAKTNDAIINGNGVSKPLGMLNGGSVITVAKETSQAADTVVAANVNKMWARLPAEDTSQAIWLHNHTVVSQLDGVNIPLTDVGGTATVVGFSTNIYNSANETLKTRPLVRSEYCKTLGDKGDIILCNPKAYAVGIRGTVKTAMSMHLRFDYDESVFRFIFEVDGQSWMNDVITPENGDTLSSVITLAARA